MLLLDLFYIALELQYYKKTTLHPKNGTISGKSPQNLRLMLF